MHFRFVAVLALLFAFGTAMADDNIQGLQNKQEFMRTRTSIEKAIAGSDDKYRELSPDDQKKVIATLDRMNERWQKADDATGLSADERVAMANDQEIVTTILDHASADSRMVCERVATIGSNLPKSVCKTVAQRRREQKEAQDAAIGGTLEQN